MRLFVAVELSAACTQTIAAFSEELRRRAIGLAPRARVAWVRPEQLHVTVRFIGDVDETRAAAIAAVLQPELSVKGFEMTIAGAGAFPPRGAPRVFWAGVASGADALSALAHEAGERLVACGVEREDRPYRPHVTLARVRDASGLRSPALFETLAEQRFGVTPVGAITLFQSQTSPKRATYVALQRTPLCRV